MSLKRVIALGFFDGVHRGHGALLQTARRRADVLGCQAVGLTFDPHPEALIRGIQPPLLNTLEDRRWLMTQLYGMDEMLVLPFDDAMMRMPWQDFVETVLAEQFGAVHVVCGHDYRFGCGGQGDAQKLQALCSSLGIGCDVVDKVEHLGGEVSSTRIRACLLDGDLETANALLGHPHFFSGTVAHGKKLGRLLGCPTANQILPNAVLEPVHGVYATRAHLPDGSCHIAVTNVGSRPSLDDGQHVTVESWLLDYDGNLYDRVLRVEFCKFLRPEQTFGSLDDLVAAVKHDGESARAYFESEIGSNEAIS